MQSNHSHDGEREMRKRFGSPYTHDEQPLDGMIMSFISPSLAAFIHRQPFFFIATADAAGNCDASFRGREHNASGEPLLACAVTGRNELLFPDYKGNGFFNSLGNIVQNPHIGMLFVDFEQQRRARINGRAEIIEVDEELRQLWPQAKSIIRVTVEQAYGNCPARIPKMRMEVSSFDE